MATRATCEVNIWAAGLKGNHLIRATITARLMVKVVAFPAHITLEKMVFSISSLLS
jgi:hypothetical protein